MGGENLRPFGKIAVEPNAAMLRRNEKLEAYGGCVNLWRSLDLHSAFFRAPARA